MRFKKYTDNMIFDEKNIQILSIIERRSEKEADDSVAEHDNFKLCGKITITATKLENTIKYKNTKDDGIFYEEEVLSPAGSPIGILDADIRYYLPDDYIKSYTVMINNIEVDKEYSRIGIGSYLLNRLEECSMDDFLINSYMGDNIDYISGEYKSEDNESLTEFFNNCGYDNVEKDDFTRILKNLNDLTEETIPKGPITVEEVKNIKDSIDLKKTIKLFVSQPMSGLTIDQIKADRHRVELDFCNNYNTNDDIVLVIDNLQEDKPVDTPSLHYLSEDIKLMNDADYIYFCKGWETHRGCIIEFTVAREFKIPMIFEQ